ncbi:MAG: lipoprotein [Pseudomonadota bacterium]|nr:lipoprotein [Pseudomonadota bacterium]
MVYELLHGGRRLLLLGWVLAALTGCGQKGALYMPQQAPASDPVAGGCRTPECAAISNTNTDTAEDQSEAEDDADRASKETPQ